MAKSYIFGIYIISHTEDAMGTLPLLAYYGQRNTI